MIKAIISGIFKLILSLVNLLLTPINSLITNAIPSLSPAFASIRAFCQYGFQFCGWTVDALCINTITIDLIIAYATAKLTIPLAINLVKIAIKWYRQLMP